MEITPTGDVDPATKRANLKLLLAMIVFAIGLAALCVVWMHFHAERMYNEQIQGSPSSFVPRSQAPAWERRDEDVRLTNFPLRIRPLDSQPFSC